MQKLKTINYVVSFCRCHEAISTHGRGLTSEEGNYTLVERTIMFTKTAMRISMVLFVVAAFTIAAAQAHAGQTSQPGPQLTEMSLEELMNVQIVSTAALTKTTKRLTPGTVTTIAQDDIWHSGARSLDELLDIFVPNFQWIRHPWEYQHLGLRGIISDRDHKYLLLVNGRVMNEHTHYGAFSERDLPMLRDIHHVDVIRGPGSALYGPGAIAMVINIVTENATNFQGSEATARLGAFEEFYSGEYKYAEKTGENSGLYVYTGISDYQGADSGAAPFVWGAARNGWGSEDHDGGDVVGIRTAGDNRAFEGLPKLKLFTDYTTGNFDVWVRYTRGGGHYGPDLFGTMWTTTPDAWSSGYQQVTAYTSYKQEVSETFGIDYALSYDMFDFQRLKGHDTAQDATREDEYYGRVMGKWNPAEAHSLAFGAEISHEEFGFKSPSYDGDVNPYTDTFGAATPRWNTDLYSLLGEYQWNISDKFTTFVGSRFDWHDFTPRMWSPRAVLVYTPNIKDTVKVSYTRSVRAPQAAEMYKEWVTNNEERSKPERIFVWELRYERQQSDHWWLAGSLFRNDLDVVGAASGVSQVGNLITWGFEAEIMYKTDKTRFSVSHALTKQVDFDDRGTSEFPPSVSERGKGYGNDLAAWNNNSTKFYFQEKLTDKFTFDSSLRIYWGSPGQEEYANWVKGNWDDIGWNQWCYDREHNDTFDKPTAFLNLGLQYEPMPDLTIRVDGYNLLGIFDRALNKRFMVWDNLYPADARASAPALGVSLRYKF